MAKRIQAEGQRFIQADNGLGWSRTRGASVLAVVRGKYVTEVFGLRYELQKFRDDNGHGWYLYSRPTPHFHAEYCAPTLLAAIDAASDMILKADLRGEGYEKKGR